MPFPSDLQIAQGAALKPLGDIAAAMGIGTHLLEAYGEHVAKIKLSAIDELADRPKAKYVVVSAVTPTPLGEGKTTTTVGLGQALCGTSGGRPRWRSASRRWARRSGSRAARPAAATARSCRWSCSTCTSPATSTP